MALGGTRAFHGLIPLSVSVVQLPHLPSLSRQPDLPHHQSSGNEVACTAFLAHPQTQHSHLLGTVSLPATLRLPSAPRHTDRLLTDSPLLHSPLFPGRQVPPQEMG